MGRATNSLRERIRTVVKRFKHRGMASRFDTSDVIQEVELQVWKRKQTQPDCDSVGPALLSTITKRHLAKLRRLHDAGKRSVGRESSSDNSSATSRELPPEEYVEFKELTSKLLAIIDRLDPVMKDVLNARIFQKKSLAKAAEDLGMTVHQVRTYYDLALCELRKQIQPSKDSE